MALIICPECGTQVSNIAEQCPRCGYPISAYHNARTANRRTTAGNANAMNGSTPSQGGVFYVPVAREAPDNGQHYVDRYPQTYAPYPRQQADETSDWKRLLPWFLVPFLVIAILVSLGIYFVPGLLSTTTYLRADTENINALRPAAVYKISLHSDGKTYKLAHAPAWATTKLKDSLLVCKISENTTHADRADSIVVTNGKLRMLIKVQQTGAASFLRVDDNSGFLSGNSNTFQGYTNGVSSCTFSYESWKKAPTWDDHNIVGNIQ